MDALPPSEIQMPSFVLSLLLERFRARQALGGRRKLLIVIEEAHNFLDRRQEGEGSGREMGSGGHLLKQLVRLLQEGRELGLGVMVIDQSPGALADAVIKNTNTKVVLRISDSEEARLIGSGLGLAEDEWRDLHELEDHECIVKTKNVGKAVKLAPLQWQKDPAVPPVPKASPPDYMCAWGVLQRIARNGAESNWQMLSDELLKACIGSLPLAHYIARKFRFLQFDGAEVSKWRDLPEPGATSELPLLLRSLAGVAGEFSLARREFAVALSALLNGDDAGPPTGGDERWFGPIEALANILRKTAGWEEEGAAEGFRGNLLQWVCIDAANPGLATVRARLRLTATLFEQRKTGIEQALTHLAANNSGA
jgi:hypothetical protein